MARKINLPQRRGANLSDRGKREREAGLLQRQPPSKKMLCMI
jgi:hypothetical protein